MKVSTKIVQLVLEINNWLNVFISWLPDWSDVEAVSPAQVRPCCGVEVDMGVGSIKTNFCETLLTLLSLSCAHNTVPTVPTLLPNNIDKLSFHARRVECNCNSVYTIFCFVRYGIGFVFGWNIWDGVEERGCGETRQKRNAKT